MSFDLENLGDIKVRHLRDGESVDFSEIGVPGVSLLGSGVLVSEDDEGGLHPCGLTPAHVRRIEALVFAHLVIYNQGVFSPVELKFLRRVSDLSIAEWGQGLGLSPEQVRGLEREGSPIPEEVRLRAGGMLLGLLPKVLSSVLGEVAGSARAGQGASVPAAEDAPGLTLVGDPHLPFHFGKGRLLQRVSSGPRAA